MQSWLPAAAWVPQYQWSTLRHDLIAGVTLAAYLIPAGLGDASLANLPSEAGLYACIFSGLVFWPLCSSRQTAITITSSLSLLVGASLGEFAGGDVARYGALAATTALVAGALSFVAWLVRAGVLVDFISETVLVGFKCGIALVIASTQLPKLFGLSGSHGDFWERVTFFLSHLYETNALSLVVGLCALGALLVGKRYWPRLPVSLFVVIVAIAMASVTDLGGRDVKMLGEVPQGLPSPRLPAIQAGDVNDVLPLAMACFLLGAVETAAIGRMYARKHGYRFDPNQEFLALASANLAAGLGQGLPVSGGMSQSLVNEAAGARTPLSSLVAAVVTLIVTLSLSGMLRNLPQPVLAAIVLVAVSGLVKIPVLKKLWQFDIGELGIAAVAMVGVLGSGILRGVLIGAVLSLVLLLRRGSRPYTTELGRVADTEYFSDRVRHPENAIVPGVFLFRCDGPLLYFNVQYVQDRFVELLTRRDGDVELVIFFLGTTPAIDLAGAEMLEALQTSLSTRGIALELAEAHGGVRETLDRLKFCDRSGRVEANKTVASILRRWADR